MDTLPDWIEERYEGTAALQKYMETRLETREIYDILRPTPYEGFSLYIESDKPVFHLMKELSGYDRNLATRNGLPTEAFDQIKKAVDTEELYNICHAWSDVYPSNVQYVTGWQRDGSIDVGVQFA